MKYFNNVLNNGIQIIMVPMKNTKIISMGFYIKAGSRNENNNNRGIAHFLEHMMFKGTIHRSAEKLFNQLDTLGAVYNAATTAQHTYYYINGNCDNTKELLDIMLDIYIYPKFESDEISKEKKVIIEEMRMRFDLPMNKLYSKIHQKFFVDTNLAYDITGTIDSVNNLTKNDLIDFNKCFYKPNNTVFVITGNFDPIPIFSILKNILEPLINNDLPIPTYINDKKIILQNMKCQKEPYIYMKKDNTRQQVYAILAFPIYDYYNYKNGEIDLLTELLSFGASSRLKKALREKNGITYTSVAYPLVYSDCGLMLIQMVLNPEQLIVGLEIILKELSKIKRDLITNEEYTKIINVTKNNTIYSLIHPLEISKYFGLNFLFNRQYLTDLNKKLIKIKKITPMQIRDLAKKIFNKNKINLFLYGNIDQINYNFIM